LVNGDSSGLTEEDSKEATRFEKDIREYYGDDARIVDCGEDSEFGIPSWGGPKGNIIPFTIEYDPRHLPQEYWDVSNY
jgi:hypothetical protein